MQKVLDSDGNLLPRQPPTRSPVSEGDTNEGENSMQRSRTTPPEAIKSSQESIKNAQTPRESRKWNCKKREGKTHRRDSSNGEHGRPRNRQRSDEKTAAALEMSVRKSEESITKLQEDINNGTCPKTLRYSARAKIRPDPEFKSDIKKIRKEAERKLLGALKKFHYRSAERNKLKLRELERKSCFSAAPSTSNKNYVKPHSANNNKSNVETSVQRSASNIQAQLDHLKQMMEKLEKTNTNRKSESYPCLLSECTNKSNRGKNIEKRKITNKTPNTCRKTARKEHQRKTYKSNKQKLRTSPIYNWQLIR